MHFLHLAARTLFVSTEELKGFTSIRILNIFCYRNCINVIPVPTQSPLRVKFEKFLQKLVVGGIEKNVRWKHLTLNILSNFLSKNCK